MPYSAGSICALGTFAAMVGCSERGLVDESVCSSLLAGDAFKVDPGICVRLGRGEVRTTKLVSFRTLSERELVTPEMAQGTAGALVEVRCFESNVCCGCSDGNWY